MSISKYLVALLSVRKTEYQKVILWFSGTE